MTYERFSYLVGGLDYETQYRIDTEIARLTAYDHDADLDWELLFNREIQHTRRWHDPVWLAALEERLNCEKCREYNRARSRS